MEKEEAELFPAGLITCLLNKISEISKLDPSRVKLNKVEIQI